LPKTTWTPSKNPSPTITTLLPPDIHPSLGDTAFITGCSAAASPKEND